MFLESLRSHIAQEGILPKCQLLSGSHDTASAVAAVAAGGERAGFFISSVPGRWWVVESTAGNQRAEPGLQLHNEGRIGGTFRFLKNISGLWLVQECRVAWAAGRAGSILMPIDSSGGGSPAFHSLVDPSAPDFLHPREMPERIGRYCLKRGQPAPTVFGQLYVRPGKPAAGLSESDWSNGAGAGLTRWRLVHIVGGGSQNRFAQPVSPLMRPVSRNCPDR